MARESHRQRFSLGSPAVYRIVVQGPLEERFADRLGGMEIAVSGGPAAGQVTTLVGRVLDQAQLIGVLNALYELRLPIRAVERLEGAEGSTSPGRITG